MIYMNLYALETQLTVTFAMKNRLFELFYIYERNRISRKENSKSKSLHY